MQSSHRQLHHFLQCQSIIQYARIQRQGSPQFRCIETHFPVAWQHINFYGHYEFNKYPESVNMDAIIQELAQLRLFRMNNSYPFEGKVRINETRTKLAARSKPHILDDATVNRVIRILHGTA